MFSIPLSMRAWVVLLLFLLAGQTAPAQETTVVSGEYEPRSGQPGKDVVWVPTPDEVVEQMLTMASVGPEDYVIDLGSGDGRTVIAAAKKYGARAMGIEYNPDMVTLSRRKAEEAGITDQVEFIEGDIFETDFSQATVLTMYLLPSLNERLRPRILQLPPGTRVVSHAWDMADWEADQMVTIADSDVYFWIVPVDVEGNWTISVGGESWKLRLIQDFQLLYGRIRIGDESFRLLDGRVRGTQIHFQFDDANGNRRVFSGRVNGKAMEGTLRNPDSAADISSAVVNRADGSLGEIDLSF